MKISILALLCLVAALPACKRSDPKAAAAAPVKPYQPKDRTKPDLFLARSKGKYGFIDKTGKFVLPPIYRKALEFSEGLAPVEAITGKWGFVDTSGTPVIPPLYDLALPFSEGLATVQSGSLFGAINKAGEMIVKPKFAGISQFNEGLAATIFEQTVQAIKLRGWGYIKPD